MVIGAIDTESPARANVNSFTSLAAKAKQQWKPPGCPVPVASQLKVLSGSIF